MSRADGAQAPHSAHLGARSGFQPCYSTGHCPSPLIHPVFVQNVGCKQWCPPAGPPVDPGSRLPRTLQVGCR